MAGGDGRRDRHHIKNTPRVTDSGGAIRRFRLRRRSDNIFNRLASAAEWPRPKMTFEKNEVHCRRSVHQLQGKVEDVNPERNTLLFYDDLAAQELEFHRSKGLGTKRKTR
jgi:hypothetical protein